MSTSPYYVTTAIPYVNGAPHLGHALEFVQADVLARHRRLRGQPVRFLTGTDENALKNVVAARAANIPVADFVAANSRRFLELRSQLNLSFDDFLRTSADPRHRTGVDRLWRESSDHGDFYRRHYRGQYCLGCERFYTPDELVEGVCIEHGTPAEFVSEENWFFRLTRYADRIRESIESGAVRIEPSSKRAEVLGFLRSDLQDFSVSRKATRAGGWGIAVPGDPDQVIYVWWDALANYVTALGYGNGGSDFRRWWCESGERVHVIGKGILRFHAVYWLALLLSAGLPLPTTILVHDYITVAGSKLAKSAGQLADPAELVARFGADAVRWWLIRDVPRIGDTEFSVERLTARYTSDLANGVGNLVNRSIALVRKFAAVETVPAADRDGDGDRAEHRDGGAQSGVGSIGELRLATDELPSRVDRHLDDADFRGAAEAILAVAARANKLVNAEQPWVLARLRSGGDGAAGERLAGLLDQLLATCRVVARELLPFVPDGAGELLRQLGVGPLVGAPKPVFVRR